MKINNSTKQTNSHKLKNFADQITVKLLLKKLYQLEINQDSWAGKLII